MITIGTVRFDFQTDCEPFAHALNGRWDTFFRTSFEEVVEAVLSVYDVADEVITIDTLLLDLGGLEEEAFDRHFPLRLRAALEDYCQQWITGDGSSARGIGVRRTSVGRTAFDLLSFFLLHGYLPSDTDALFLDLSYLLRCVVHEEPSLLRDFLNSYGHYDYLCRRLVYQFTDEELETIVRIVQPSESIFINLYVRLQVRAYASLNPPSVSRHEYRDAVWILVLAYLFAESEGHFSRKQLIMHTLRGIAARLNDSFAEITHLLTERIEELEQTTESLPQLWSLLKEIRQDVQAELWVLDGNYQVHLIREIVAALRLGGRGGEALFLSFEHINGILSDELSCRELLGRLSEAEIQLLVGIIVPDERDFVISYARLLDKHKEIGTFRGKAGNDLRLLKWEFIFAVLIALPASTFSRKRFVLSVLQRLGAHYNLTVTELIHLLSDDIALLEGTFLSVNLLRVLHELDDEGSIGVPALPSSAELSFEEWVDLLSTPLLARRFIQRHTEQQIGRVVTRLLPGESEFIISYAQLLDKGHRHGWLEGKAGGEFRSLKWEFIFSCLLPLGGIAFHQKTWVYGVLRQLAAHYNQTVVDLLDYFLHEGMVLVDLPSAQRLKTILEELYEEHSLPLTAVSLLRQKSDRELEHWLLHLFGANAPLATGREAYLEHWLVYFLNERNACFRSAWKSGKLSAPLLFGLLKRTPSLRRLWLRRIGDARLLTLYRDWLTAYGALRSRFSGLYFLQSIGEYLTDWMVELTARPFAAWSETEVIRFLTVRLKKSLPPGLAALSDEIRPGNQKEMNEIINRINEFNKKGILMEQHVVSIKNGGIVLISPFLPRLFAMLGLMSEDRRAFKDEHSRVRALFLLQYIVYGEQQEYPETELPLNKLLVGKGNDSPIPRRLDLTEEEIRVADSLIQSVKEMWEKVKHTSPQALRESFFQREATLAYQPEHEMWVTTVKERAYDVLIDSIPWSFKMIRFPWMDKRIQINWR